MHRLPFSIAALLIMAITGAACSRGADEARDPSQRSSSDGDSVTVAGCLTANPNGNMVLTADADEAVGTAARAGSGTRETYTYQLVGGQNLQQHVGKRVQITGTLKDSDEEVELESKNRTESPSSVPRSDEKARVDSKEEIDVQIRQLQVTTVRPLAATCDLIQ
jgi:hypothetical protein